VVLLRLGGFIHWYTNGDIDRPPKERKDSPSKVEGRYPKWPTLAAATREDYLEAFEYLRPEFDIVLKDITQPDLYDVREKCAHRKWSRFVDQMIAALSSMFRQAVKRGKMPFNPCTGMDDAHKADPNSNREWFQEEWNFAREKAPLEVLIPIMLARHCGLRGQTIVKVNRKQIVDHDLTGKAMRYYARKNKKIVTLPMMQELQDFLAELKVQRADRMITVRQRRRLALAKREADADPSEPLAARPGTRWPCRKGNDAARPPGILRRMVAAQRRHRCGGDRPDRRLVGTHGQALHPPRRIGDQHQPRL